ncbi:MAG: thiamine pyrophosphate-dependent enzyme [Acidiferrobacterales bacterium]
MAGTSSTAKMYNRAIVIDERFRQRTLARDFPARATSLTPASVGLTPHEIADLFESQLISRHLDLISRKLSARRESYYTIGSAGHEGNAVLGKVFRATDMAFLHYRSAAFLVQRSKQRPGETPIYDLLLSFVASSDDPISGGRHKVLGSKTLMVPPQTSTIASHLPKSVGAAHSIGLARRLEKPDCVLPHDAVIMCSFGDASVNHSTAQGAINAAAWAAVQNSPMPIVFVCEDDGIGISVKTPHNWIEACCRNRYGLKYFYCDGMDLLDTYRTAVQAVYYARRYHKPVFLHMRVVRLMGHAGSDAEWSYRSLSEIEATEAQDPLLHGARILVEHDIATPEDVVGMYDRIAERVGRVAEVATQRPKLQSAAEVMTPIVPKASSAAVPVVQTSRRVALFAKDKRLLETPQSMARLINLALADIMLQYDNTVVFGEDVARKGGVYSVTTGLYEKFGAGRVIDTLLDEQTILGLAIGLAHNGFLPIPEIQFLAYLHNAEDQLRGEAATLSFFSNDQFTNPMVVRIAGLAYQKGFGGHFHNDNSFAVLRDIPGLVIACPSNGRDAVQMLRTCVAAAHEQKRVVVFLEPIALYMTRDLYEQGDDQWVSVYEPPGEGAPIEIGELGVYGDGQDLCIVSYANGYFLSRQATRTLEQRYRIRSSLVDLRWIAPMAEERLVEVVRPYKNILIVDECRRTGSLSEALVTLLTERLDERPTIARVTAEDSFIPLAAAANLVLPSVEGIVACALKLLQGDMATTHPFSGAL